MLLAAGEAVSNAVEHGHRDNPDGAITLRADVAGTKLYLSVTDTGRWKTPVHDGTRGRGISIIRALMDDAAVEPAADGTTVRMSVNLTR